MQSPACNGHRSTWWPGLTVLNLAFRSKFSLLVSKVYTCMYSLPVLLWIYYSCIIHNCQWNFFPHDHIYVLYIYVCVCVCLSVCNCFMDRLPNRHLCLNLYPCVIKVQSVNQSISVPLSECDCFFSWCVPRELWGHTDEYVSATIMWSGLHWITVCIIALHNLCIAYLCCSNALYCVEEMSG